MTHTTNKHLLSREPDRISAQPLYCQKPDSLPKICTAGSMCLSLLVFYAIISRKSQGWSQRNQRDKQNLTRTSQSWHWRIEVWADRAAAPSTKNRGFRLCKYLTFGPFLYENRRKAFSFRGFAPLPSPPPFGKSCIRPWCKVTQGHAFWDYWKADDRVRIAKAGLISKVFEKIASENAESRRFPQHYCRLTPTPQGTSSNICIK